MPIRALIIDDDRDNANLLQLLLSRFGIVVVGYAKNGVEGLQMMHDHLPHIVIADIKMPTMDGLSMLRLKKNDDEIKEIPSICLTASVDKAVEAAMAGATYFVPKPYQLLKLVELIKQLVPNPT